jgi:flotillin
MQARIAQANADREATEREQEAAALKAAAQRDTAIKLAGFQGEQDKAVALQAQAGPLAEAEARKQVVETETKVAELEALREEKRLESTVKKPADAAAYEARVQAEGQREARIALAEAGKRETELKAEADARRVELGAAADAKAVELTAMAQATQTREVGQAEADATKARGHAEGEAVRAKGLAEAEAIGKRAEALAAESDARSSMPTWRTSAGSTRSTPGTCPIHRRPALPRLTCGCPSACSCRSRRSLSCRASRRRSAQD